MNNDRIGTWFGKDVEDLSKEELLEVIRYLGKRLRQAEEDRLRWIKAANVVDYLSQRP